MGSSKRYRDSRSRKRRFTENQHTVEHKKALTDTDSQAEVSTPKGLPRPMIPTCFVNDSNASTSARKLDLTTSTEIQDTPESFDCFIFVSFAILQSMIKEVSFCHECHRQETLRLENVSSRRMGYCYSIRVYCGECGWSREWKTSDTIQKGHSSGQKFYEINVRMVAGFREIGQGLNSMETFSRCLNMPPPMSAAAYNNVVDKMKDIYFEEALKSTSKAAAELKSNQSLGEGQVDCKVSVDGTWQRRGFSSLNGIVTAISSDSKKCLDYEVMSKICKACEKWRSLRGTDKYENWKATHKCPVNHHGSSGAMEAAGAVRIFKRSVPQHNLRFTGYIGDGDSNSFSSVVAAAPYGSEINIEKLECLGHVQKRMGNRLRNLRKSLKGQPLSDG